MGFLGALAALFAMQPDRMPGLKSILPEGVAECLEIGILPTINVDWLMLNNGEIVHYADKTCLMTNKNQHAYVRSYGGGMGISVPVDTGAVKYTPGTLFISNKRIIFTAQEKGYEKKLSQLISVKSYNDGIEFQFGSKTYCMILPSAKSAACANQTIKLLRQSKTF